MFARIADLASFQRKLKAGYHWLANKMPLNGGPLCTGWLYSVLKTEIHLVVITQASSKGSNE